MIFTVKRHVRKKSGAMASLLENAVDWFADVCFEVPGVKHDAGIRFTDAIFAV